jgi:hypothetical protein
MEQKKPKRLVLTSVNQLITLVKNNEKLAQNFPRLGGLISAPLSTAPKKSCNCGGKQNFTTPDVNKQVAESALSSLTSSDFNTIKNVLDLNELCYYKREGGPNGKLSLVCV